MKNRSILEHKKLTSLVAFALSLLVLAIGSCRTVDQGPQPPVAEKIPQELTAHGLTRTDDYYWLRERDNPRIIEYLKEEDEYLKTVMSHTEAFQEALYNEIVGRIRATDMSVPYRTQGYYYYTRYDEGKEYPVYCRKKGSLEGSEEILLDANAMAEGFAFFQVSGLAVSSDNNLLAYGVDTLSRRLFTLHFKDLRTGQTLSEHIPNTDGRAAWANDNKTVFYTMKDTTTLRPFKVMRHVLGTDTRTDQEVFIEEDETFNTTVYKSKSKRYLFIESESTLSTEYRFLEADSPGGEFKIIQPREKDLEYQVEHFQDKFYIRTNDQARNFRLMETPLAQTSKAEWKEIIPHREDVLLEGFEIFEKFLVVEERMHGLPQLRIIDWKDKTEHYLDFGEQTYSVYIAVNPEFETDLLRYEYSSLTTPDSIYDYNMVTKEKILLKREEVLGEFKPENYQAERLYATARDGTKIPLSLVYRGKVEKNGNNPLILYGYGSYGASIDPSFSSPRLSLLDRGVIYAIAHIRGGQEMGRSWYEDGKLLKKKNTFTDFIDCADHLVREKYTRPEKLFAVGASAGGLLMGAVVNMRPELFKGVIAGVPYVDVINTMLDPSIPLTTNEYDEWGNPNDKIYYDYMMSYSPYDNVEAKDYPNLLVTTGLHDSQVQYWEPAKWVAKLRAVKTDNNRLLLYTNLDAGHGGASGRFRKFRETALEYAFILDLAGINK